MLERKQDREGKDREGGEWKGGGYNPDLLPFVFSTMLPTSSTYGERTHLYFVSVLFLSLGLIEKKKKQQMQWKNEVRTAILPGHPLFPFHCACQAQPISVSADNAPCCSMACSSPLGHELKEKLLAAPRKCSSEELI